jgi:hypothetical protein
MGMLDRPSIFILERGIWERLLINSIYFVSLKGQILLFFAIRIIIAFNKYFVAVLVHISFSNFPLFHAQMMQDG